MNDNWQHRSAGMRCGTCMYFVPKAAPAAAPAPVFAYPAPLKVSDLMPQPLCLQEPGLQPSPLLGRCRRHAPTLGGWPVVFADDWCGDHKIDEAKL